MGNKPTAGEVLGGISRLAAEADWTEGEVDEALREEGIDPDELVKGVRQRLAEAGVMLPVEGCENYCAPALTARRGE
jgi:hypothetical protein